MTTGLTAVQSLENLLSRCSGISQFLVRPGPQGNMQAAAIALGDMTRIPCDAYVVPHFQGDVSFAGVGGAVARGGAGHGLMEYEKYVDALNRTQEWGEATVTKSGGGNSTHLIHVVSVGNRSVEKELRTVAMATSSALYRAHEQLLDTIVFPALGTGAHGELVAGQSARAILGSLYTYWSKEPSNRPHGVTVAIYGDRDAYHSFSAVLELGVSTQEAAMVDEGKSKKFNLARWAVDVTAGMHTEDWLRDLPGSSKKR